MAGYQKSSLSDDEQAVFNSEWDRLITRHFKVREIQDIFNDNRDAIQEACEVSKFQLDAAFGGMNCRTNEFGWGPIQPNHLLATSSTNSTAYAYRTWNQWFTTDDVTSSSTYGWKAWIGSSSADLKVTKYGCFAIIGFYDAEQPAKVDALLAKIKGVDYPVWWMGDCFDEQDYQVYELATPIIVEKEQTMYIQERVGRAGLSKLRPIGLIFGKGDYLRDKKPYAQT